MHVSYLKEQVGRVGRSEQRDCVIMMPKERPDPRSFDFSPCVYPLLSLPLSHILSVPILFLPFCPHSLIAVQVLAKEGKLLLDFQSDL